jgi:hypothetical protein
LGFAEQRCGADRGTRFAKSQFIGVHHAKMEKAEVAHGACGSPDVEWIARGDEDNPQAVGFGVG